MFILRILAVPHPEFYAPDDGSQSHRLPSPVVSLSRAEGEKPRLGGRLLLAVSAPSVGASIRALLPALPARSTAVSGLYYYPRALVLSFVNGFHSDEEPITTLPLWWRCQDALL